MFKPLFAAAALGVALCSQAVAQADPPTTGTLLGDARVIVTSTKGDVRIWTHAPRMIVMGDALVHDQVRQIVAQIEDAVASPFGPTFFGEIEYTSLPQNVGDGQGRIWSAVRRGGPAGFQVDMNLGGGFVRTTDILLVIAGRRDIAVMNGLWGMSARNTRGQLQGGLSRCFYASSSRDGVRLGAYVTIFPTGDTTFTEECLWEELVHALGPLQDAKGSKFFSFDDEADQNSTLQPSAQAQLTQAKRENDLALIRALYESGVAPGGSPEVVVDYLETILE